ncbi:MAG: hypothetical protein ACFCU6_10390, partial [Balneolaceae bacterium]
MNRNSLKFHYRWHFELESAPPELWPYLSDTNQFFKDLGCFPVHRIPLERNLSGRYQQLTFDAIHRLDAWVEEPFQWEAPFGYSVTRRYKHGHFETLTFSVEMTRLGNETQVAVTHSGTVKNKVNLLRVKSCFGTRFKRNIRKILHHYDQKIQNDAAPADNYVRTHIKNRKRWNNLIQKLVGAHAEPVHARKLISYLKITDEQQLYKITPANIAKALDIRMDEALELLIIASKLEIVTHQWELHCPECRERVHTTGHLEKITEPLYCNSCESDFSLDFNRTIEIV